MRCLEQWVCLSGAWHLPDRRCIMIQWLICLSTLCLGSALRPHACVWGAVSPAGNIFGGATSGGRVCWLQGQAVPAQRDCVPEPCSQVCGSPCKKCAANAADRWQTAGTYMSAGASAGIQDGSCPKSGARGPTGRVLSCPRGSAAGLLRQGRFCGSDTPLSPDFHESEITYSV